MRIRNRLRVTGTVQGVGFRPFVYQLAGRNGISGWVSNTSEGVVIEAEGEEECLNRFLLGLKREAPRLARVADVTAHRIDTDGTAGFTIVESAQSAKRIAMIPADVAMCEACSRDISDPGNRRFGYPFTNCTDCGPRFTIIRDIPYDRPKTTMAAFEMCPLCSREYHDPMDRRFHAQPNACPVCGPKVWLEFKDGTVDDADSINKAAAMLVDGHILAIKGLGGFHLACDARNSTTVAELRRRKGRGRKPLAVMVRDMEEARRLCTISAEEADILLSYERPIVLLNAREHSEVAPEVAPSNNCIGLMLPYTPLHHLLFRESPPALVMTSGNLSEEPISYTNEEARSRLSGIADAFLMHDRDIHVPCDDSVVRPVLGESMPIRRARGFVPGPVDLGVDAPPILACGAEQKSTFCLTVGRWAVPSQHIGDLDKVETLDYYEQAVGHMETLFGTTPKIVAFDMHPDYLASRYAQSVQAVSKVPVQHHHAHIASCMAENGLSEPVIGIAFDGTGYGVDGAIWGGEVLVADLISFERAAHLRYVPMPGGAAAIRRPSRMALAYIRESVQDLPDNLIHTCLHMSDSERRIIEQQIDRGINCPPTSSMGRLFDAVSAILGLCTDASFEGEPAILIEMCAARADSSAYGFVLTKETGENVIDTRQLIREVIEDLLAGTAVPTISDRFHNTVVDIIAASCTAAKDIYGTNDVVLSGGCFQNVRLLEQSIGRLTDLGFSVYRHHIVPTNDGGISLGQAAIAAARWANRSRLDSKGV